MTRIAVVIPVGPEEHHARYLDEALASVAAQTRDADWLVVVDDMQGRDLEERVRTSGAAPGSAYGDFFTDVHVHVPPWRLGVGSAFNHGVAIALEDCDLALMMGADDKLEPHVLEHLEAKYESEGKRDGFYWFDVIYSDGEEQALPCNAAAVTAGFMRETGGLPIEASAGGMDAALVSALLVHRPHYLHHVRGAEGRYWVRRHAEQEGARLNAYAGAMGLIRNVYTAAWRPTNWGRYG